MHSLVLLLLVGSIPSLILILPNTAFIRSNLQKDCHQDNLSSIYLYLYKYNFLNILVDNSYCHLEAKIQ